MRHKPNHTCLPTFQLIHGCAGCAFELGESEAKRKPTEAAKYVWMIVGNDNPCDIRRYSFSHKQGVEQLSHTKDYKDYTGGVWTLFKLVRVNKRPSNLIPLPEKKKGGRKSGSPLANSGNVTSIVKRVDSAV